MQSILPHLNFCSSCVSFTGLKAINTLHSLKSNQDIQIGDRVSFVIVYTVYNNSYGSDSARMDDKLSDIVTVGSNFYNKVERSMAILNAFINFIQVIGLCRTQNLPPLSNYFVVSYGTRSFIYTMSSSVTLSRIFYAQGQV